MGLQININSINISSQWGFFSIKSYIVIIFDVDGPLVRAALEMTQFSKINNLEFH